MIPLLVSPGSEQDLCYENKDLSKIWQRFHKVFQQTQFWHILTEWSILGKTQMLNLDGDCEGDGDWVETGKNTLQFYNILANK